MGKGTWAYIVMKTIYITATVVTWMLGLAYMVCLKTYRFDEAMWLFAGAVVSFLIMMLTEDY